MKKRNLLERVLLNPFFSYLLVAVFIFVGMGVNLLLNDLSVSKSYLESVQTHDAKETKVTDTFFKDVRGDWDRIDIVDKSHSLASLPTLNYNLQDQSINTKSRLVVFIDDTNDLSFDRETTDIMRLADDAKTSLLAINSETDRALLHLAPEVGGYFTDQEAQQFIDQTIKPALIDNKLRFVVLSTIEKFHLEITGKNFYTASDLHDAQLATTTSGAARNDYLLEAQYAQKEVNELETAVADYIIGLVVLLCLGLYHIWRTPDKVYGFLFGMAVGFVGYILANNLSDKHEPFIYEVSIMPIILATVAGGLVGLLVDYLFSVPKAKSTVQPEKPKSRQKRNKHTKRSS